jgi:hypothetical protein
MSTDRKQVCTGLDGPTPGPNLPVYLLSEIAQRVDGRTLVRFAATSKVLRKDILNPYFRKGLLEVRATAGRWFDATLLRGVSCFLVDPMTRILNVDVIGTPQSSQSHIHMDQQLLLDFMPVVSRDGFLILRPRDADEEAHDHMCVYDNMTGQVVHLPPSSLEAEEHGQYTPAVLSVDVDDAGRSFELLVATTSQLKFQTYSSKAGQWRAVRTVSGRRSYVFSDKAHPAVIERTVHWACYDLMSWSKQIVALDVDEGRWTMQPLPLRDLVGDITIIQYLLTAVGGQLVLIIVGCLEVSLWISKPSWRRQLVIRTAVIERSVGLELNSTLAISSGLGFGERSGTLVMQLTNGDLVRVDLGSKEATMLCKGMRPLQEVSLHEMDFALLLQAMKSY